MLLEINKTVTETLEIPTPSYYKSKYGGKFIHITDTEDVIIANVGMIMTWRKEDGIYRNDTIREALSATFEPCTATDFEKAYNDALTVIATAYEANQIPQP